MTERLTGVSSTRRRIAGPVVVGASSQQKILLPCDGGTPTTASLDGTEDYAYGHGKVMAGVVVTRQAVQVPVSAVRDPETFTACCPAFTCCAAVNVETPAVLYGTIDDDYGQWTEENGFRFPASFALRYRPKLEVYMGGFYLDFRFTDTPENSGVPVTSPPYPPFDAWHRMYVSVMVSIHCSVKAVAYVQRANTAGDYDFDPAEFNYPVYPLLGTFPSVVGTVPSANNWTDFPFYEEAENGYPYVDVDSVCDPLSLVYGFYNTVGPDRLYTTRLTVTA